jgi:hypothetical protein
MISGTVSARLEAITGEFCGILWDIQNTFFSPIPDAGPRPEALKKEDRCSRKSILNVPG